MSINFNSTNESAYGILNTQEERDNFMAMSNEKKATFVYEIWKRHNFKVKNLLPKSDGVCADDNPQWWDEAVLQDRVMYDSLREYRDAAQLAEERKEECLEVCSECPLVAHCLTAATCIEGENPAQIEHESGSIYGGVGAEEHEEINGIIASIWDEDFRYGGAKVRGMNRFEVYEEELREEFGNEAFEQMRKEEIGA